MQNHDFSRFVDHYRALRLGSMDFAFVLLWRSKLDDFDPGDLIFAADEVAADPRASFPLNDLPLIIEFAAIRRDRRIQDAQLAEYRELQRNHEIRKATR